MKSISTDSFLYFNKQISRLFLQVIRVATFNYKYFLFWTGVLFHQKNAYKKRKHFKRKDVIVPPIMIVSITNKCNLRCKGCYALQQKRDEQKEIGIERLRLLFEEADVLGIRIIMLAGGEPFMRKDVLQLASENKKIIFPVFTNGTLVDERMQLFLNKNKNVFPVLSIEGQYESTDDRRGKGMFNSIVQVAVAFKEQKQFFGLSITLTRENFDQVLNQDFVKDFTQRGSRLFFYVEYVPGNNSDLPNCLTSMQKQRLPKLIKQLRDKNKAFFIALPGEEDQYGGCLAGGRGFIHVSSTGALEPCPFAPYSDVNLKEMSLKSALNSDFLKTIRSEHHSLKESAGGCSLWENKEWVEKKLGEKSMSA